MQSTSNHFNMPNHIWQQSCQPFLLLLLTGAQALRCLALAYKPASKDMGASLSPLDEAGLTFVAMVAMHDPPRRCASLHNDIHSALSVTKTSVCLHLGGWVGLGEG
jgi:hypothetical protein